jgi:excisionase family DNA binding protein
MAEVTEELNVSVNQMRALIRTGGLPATRNRQGHRLIERQMLERWIFDMYAETRGFLLEHDPSGRRGRRSGRSGSTMPVNRPQEDEAGAETGA